MNAGDDSARDISMMTFSTSGGIIASDPTVKLCHPKIVKKEKVCPTEDEVAKFLEVLAAAKNAGARLMIFLFVNTGTRFKSLNRLLTRLYLV